uniref:Uncharacterized protein n=1 Tax=Anguilla anguilla TaxID=7936 RepID=A0A0E9RBZ9_ANGAN
MLDFQCQSLQQTMVTINTYHLIKGKA